MISSAILRFSSQITDFLLPELPSLSPLMTAAQNQKETSPFQGYGRLNAEMQKTVMDCYLVRSINLIMRKQTRVVAVASAAALLAIGASITSFAATGWVKEEGQWYFYDKDGNRVEDEYKKVRRQLVLVRQRRRRRYGYQ
jgi:hypothetical protein